MMSLAMPGTSVHRGNPNPNRCGDARRNTSSTTGPTVAHAAAAASSHRSGSRSAAIATTKYTA